ncbi:MAG: hypothetical protein EXR93_09100 [Gemmatimonadetes bacterium]|nr:hypothetical protein [Gemmatimonadota bacterium]
MVLCAAAPAGADHRRGRHRGAVGASRGHAPRHREVGGRPRCTPRRLVRAGGRTPLVDGVLPQAARGKDLEAYHRRVPQRGLDHRVGVREAQGQHDPYRSHGRPHGCRPDGPFEPARSDSVLKYVVAVADPVNERGLEILRAIPEFEVAYAAGKPDQLAQILPRAHALLVRSETKVTEAMLALAPLLRVVGRAGTGVDNVDVDAATRRGIAVLNTPGGNTVSAAEQAVALMLALVRRVPWAAESMRRGEWDRKKFGGIELRDKVLGLVGLGRIGAHVASVARALGMDVLAHDPFLSEDRAREMGVSLCGLDDLLARADVVSLHLPLTAETKNLIDARRLSLMKPSSVLVNTARGGLVDEAALLEAVTAGKLAGAALDVFEQEPLPKESPLRGSDRLILTPHLAASTTEAQERVAVEICRAVKEALLTGVIGGAVNVPGLSSEVVTRAPAVAGPGARGRPPGGAGEPRASRRHRGAVRRDGRGGAQAADAGYGRRRARRHGCRASEHGERAFGCGAAGHQAQPEDQQPRDGVRKDGRRVASRR